MNLNCDSNGYLASSLDVELQFYQNGIMRALIDEADSTRMRISEEDLPIEWNQLIPLSKEDFTAAYKATDDGFTSTGLKHEAGLDDATDYTVTMNPFTIT